MIISNQNWEFISKQFNTSEPFKHAIIDNFFTPEVSKLIADEFPKEYNDPIWNVKYNNAIEKKIACNHWDKFPETTYRVFDYLCNDFNKIIEKITSTPNVKSDIGLHGGGLHCHKSGDKLNVHLDYSIHPKLKLERHYNLIIYMTPDWQPEWGGGLELWSHDFVNNKPLECIHTIENKFNRAVIFDTTQHAWHGLPKPISCPDNVHRQSLAVYYLTEPKENVDPRGKALFAPFGEQANDPEVMELIKTRSYRRIDK